MGAMKVRVAEIFESIQGEGIWSGIPSTFIRLSGCNLRCVWCDTPYASWNPEGPVMSAEELVQRVSPAISHVVLTGGEPLLFDPSEELCAELKSRGHIITIETAGTIYREIACDLMSISPKLANSRPPAESGWLDRHEHTRRNLVSLTELVQRYHFQLKFVVDPSNAADLQEIDQLLEELPPIPPDRILLMPEGTDSATLNQRLRQLVPLAMERGWRLTPRLHVDLFGNTRGT